MIGFFARWVEGELVPDPTEIVDAGWFRRDALPPIPPPISIARRLIDGRLRDAACAGADLRRLAARGDGRRTRG